VERVGLADDVTKARGAAAALAGVVPSIGVGALVGSLTISSSPGRGTTLRVEIPCE
jgi:hypothetical protein